MAPYPTNPFSTEALRPDQTAAYLARLRLPSSTLSQGPSLAQLTELFYAQCLWIPKDTSSLHVPPGDWNGPSRTIELGRNHGGSSPGGMSDDPERAFELVVGQNRGGFCFVTSGLWMRLLRALGYRVSLCATRCYLGEWLRCMVADTTCARKRPADRSPRNRTREGPRPGNA